MYDKNNVFYKILKSEIPADKIYEDEFVLSFYDIYPKSKIHALVIPKNLYRNFYDFMQRATSYEQNYFFSSIAKIVEILGIEKSGFRLISNTGVDAHQEVDHFHVHILGGAPIG